MSHVLGTLDEELFAEHTALEHPLSVEGSRRALPAPLGSFSLLPVSSFPGGFFFLAFSKPEGTSGAAWHVKEGKIKMAEFLKK